MPETDTSLFIHIPTPGDHYSAATGSATMTIIHTLAMRHAQRGGRTQVVVNQGTRHDYAVGECLEVRGPAYPSKAQKMVDLGLGRLGMGRHFGRRLYRPHLAAIAANFTGPVFIHNGPVAITLARKMLPKACICLWAHNDLFRTYSPAEVKAVAEAADRLICVSRFTAEQQIRLLPRELAAKVYVVSNGVDTDQFKPAELAAKNAAPVILFVGRMHEVKGPDLLIRAAVKLARQGQAFRLKIVGSQNFSATDPLTPYQQALREWAAPIADRVEFLPFTQRDQVTSVYQSADINVVPSNWDEPFGLTVLEGLACGLPSVVSRRGGIPEAAGEAALYFDPPNVDQLAAQLNTLLADGQVRAGWANRARARALEKTWEHSYQELLAVLKGDRPARPPTRSDSTTLMHIPTPGDHYSLATGSATMSVVHELTRRHLATGAAVRIIVGRETLHDLPDGECREADFPDQRGRMHRLADVGLGWLGLPREFERRRYRPALRVIEPDFDGAILIYNGPGVVGLFKKNRPNARVCLYAVNALYRSFSRGEVRRVVDQADRVICCSQFIADDLSAHLGYTSPKVRVVHNGVDTKRFVPRTTVRSTDRPRILFIGRATPQKGPDLLLKAAQRIHGKVPPFVIRIVGSRGFAPTKDMSPYERLLRDLGEPIRDSVEFQASISRSLLLEEYHGADVFCAPSNWDDPFPLTVLEAQACGLPVISSRRGGIPEVADESILLFDPPNVEELAERLAFFIESPQRRSEWGARGRARAEKLDWENQYRIFLRAIEQQ